MDTLEGFSKKVLLDGLKQAPAGVAIYRLPDFIVVTANSLYREMVGQTESEQVGIPLHDVLPEIATRTRQMLDSVVKTGRAHYCNEVKVAFRRHGRFETSYFNFLYQPLQGSSGSVESVMVMAHDVTALTITRRKLQESEEKFRLMVMRSPIPMTILRGREMRIELANEAILKNIWGKNLEEVENKNLLDVFPDLADQQFPVLLQSVFETGEFYSGKERPVHVNGRPLIYIDFEFTPLFDSDRRVSGIMMTMHDVSEKVFARRKIEENEERLRIVLEATGLGTWELDLRTGRFDYSDRYLAAFGETQRRTHLELLAFMHPDDLTIREEAFERAFHTGLLHYASRLCWRDGSIHWIEVFGKVLFDENKEPLKMIGTSRDITDERIHEQSIKKSEEKFRLLADSMPEFIWISDRSGSLTYFNKSVYEYTGLTFEELKGQAWIGVVHPDDRGGNMKKWLQAIHGGKSFLFEQRFRRNDGIYRWHLSRATPQLDAHGNIQMWVGTSTDIHDQKAFARELEEKVFERTRELKATNEVLAKTNRELEQFAYIASHDLQEPLRKIQTFADMANKNMHDEGSVKKYFVKINTSAQRMGDLIKSVLDYSRLPSDPGQLTLSDLNDVVDHVRTDLELLMAEKEAVVESDYLPAVRGIPLQLNQLFGNLINNALKFCAEKPFIRIRCRVLPGEGLQEVFAAEPQKRYVELRFEDNGIGFDNRYKDQIFTIFQRLHGLQQYSGTGIGLALCKKIVDNHRGFITAESTPGRGSTFIVYLPA